MLPSPRAQRRAADWRSLRRQTHRPVVLAFKYLAPRHEAPGTRARARGCTSPYLSGMAVALASLFKSDVLKDYMSATDEMLSKLDGMASGAGLDKPKASKEKLSKMAHEKKMKDSMKNLGVLTSVMQGTHDPG